MLPPITAHKNTDADQPKLDVDVVVSAFLDCRKKNEEIELLMFR